MVILSAHVHDCLPEALLRNGMTVLHRPGIGRSELLSLMPSATGLIVSSHPEIDRELIARAPHLRWIARLGSGMEHIDTAYAEERGIVCLSSPEGNRQAVAEHALGMLLALQRHLIVSAEEVRKGLWNRESNRGVELSGKTVGLIGFGNTGSAFAGVLSGLGVRILAHDKYRQDFATDRIHASTPEQIAEEADVVSLHLPLTSETRYYADAAFFQRLRRRPVFINTSRGPVADTRAICEALEQDLICAAALDVLENESPGRFTVTEQEMHVRLCSNPRVMITPHIAGYTYEAHEKMSRVILQKLGIS